MHAPYNRMNQMDKTIYNWLRSCVNQGLSFMVMTKTLIISLIYVGQPMLFACIHVQSLTIYVSSFCFVAGMIFLSF